MRKYLAIVMLFFSATLFAQQHSVKGNVVDQNGLPVIGMTVLEQGTNNGTVTDVDGNYAISVKGGGNSRIHCIGLSDSSRACKWPRCH